MEDSTLFKAAANLSTRCGAVVEKIIGTTPTFTVEQAGDYVYISDWFAQLGKNIDEYVDAAGDAFARIKRYRKVPMIIRASEKVVGETAPADEKDGEHVYVYKFAVLTTTNFLQNDELRVAVGKAIPANVIAIQLCKALQWRTTDGWINGSCLAKYFNKDPLVFIRSQQVLRIVKVFKTVVRMELNDAANTTARTMWLHPILLMPFLLWTNELAAMEMMAGYFMFSGVPYPDVDVMARLIQRHSPTETRIKNPPPETRIKNPPMPPPIVDEKKSE